MDHEHAAQRMSGGALIDDLAAGLPAAEREAFVAGIVAVLRPEHDPRGSLDDLPPDVAAEILVARAAVRLTGHRLRSVALRKVTAR